VPEADVALVTIFCGITIRGGEFVELDDVTVNVTVEVAWVADTTFTL
jgi:hypothetical protein